MNNDLKTLLHALDSGAPVSPSARTLFINAQNHAGLNRFTDLTYHQDFKPYAVALGVDDTGGDQSCVSMPMDETYDQVFILMDKNITAAKYQIACGLSVLNHGGLLVCAASNDAGGKRLVKLLNAFGVDDIHDVSKNKARAVWGINQKIDQGAIDTAISDGAMQVVPKTEFTAQPGMFGWNKIDQGSVILTDYLPQTLGGAGADFGCGYGYLSRHVLQNCDGIKTLYCADADHKAIQAARINLKDYAGQTEFIWADLTTSHHALQGLDFIVMNPPFHAGKKTDSDIGMKFIETARQSLKKGGVLYMVANTHLPYEDVLKKKFSPTDLLEHKKGFKIFKALC